MKPTERIIVLDYGSQYNLLITRRLRECSVYAELWEPEVPWEEIARGVPVAAVILSGGPRSVYEEGAPGLPVGLLASGLPILGICYGMQLLAKECGGQVVPGDKREYGAARFRRHGTHALFEGLEPEESSWMSHGDQVHKLPEGFSSLASTDSALAAMGDDERRLYALQFHPEVSHTPKGTTILRNFLKLAGCRLDWNSENFIEASLRDLKEQVGEADVACALSGGVDSTVAAALMHRAIGPHLHCFFVDNGLLRSGEADQVMESLLAIGLPVRKLDCSGNFFKALDGLTEPEAKRKAIGHQFIEAFEKAIESEGRTHQIGYLVQGTLYPDIVESGAGGAGSHKKAANIKTHHNVGGLPDRMKLKLVEPLRQLFKDEVRRVGVELGLPRPLLERQPFPGPGLAVRVLGAVTPERVERLRGADLIVREELDALPLQGPCRRPWQYFAVLLPVQTVGVMGDQRTYAEVAAVRAVYSEDAMTAEVARLDWDILERIASRIVNEVKGINRVVYDITSKPPGTIEWE